MKKLNYLILIVGLVLSSCAKEKMAREPTIQNPFIDETEMAFINLEGYSPVTGQPFRGDISLYEDLRSFVTITDPRESLSFITRNDASFEISKVAIKEQTAGSYLFQNVLDTDPEVVLSGLKSHDGTIEGRMRIANTNVKISFNSELISDNAIKNGKLPLEEDGFSRAIPILIPIIVGGIVITGTAIQCAYERTAARLACEGQYDKCLVHCTNNCYYSYDSGLCGGSCEIQCK